MNLVGVSGGVNMDRIIFVVLLLTTLAMSVEEVKKTDNDYEDDYYDDPAPIGVSEEVEEAEDTTEVSIETLEKEKEVNITDPVILNVENKYKDREELTTPKQVAKYEVTEFVDDIPDVSTKRIPVITNFTLTRPLNFAGVSNNKTDNVGENVKDEGDEIINSILIPYKPKVSKNNKDEGSTEDRNRKEIDKDDDENNENNFFSDFNSKNTFSEEFDKEFGSDEDDFEDSVVDNEPKPSKGFKDHFRNFRKSIVNEFKSVVNNHKDGIRDSLRKFVNGPIAFFSKLGRKSSDLALKIHKAVSRHKYHDQDDNGGYHGHHHDYTDD